MGPNERSKPQPQPEPPAKTTDPMEAAVRREAQRQGMTLTEPEIKAAVKRAKRLQRGARRHRPRLKLR